MSRYDDIINLPHHVSPTHRLAYIADHIHEQPEVRIKYFVLDEHKSGGAIVEISHKVTKNSASAGTITSVNNKIIQFCEIVEISLKQGITEQSPLFVEDNTE